MSIEKLIQKPLAIESLGIHNTTIGDGGKLDIRIIYWGDDPDDIEEIEKAIAEWILDKLQTKNGDSL